MIKEFPRNAQTKVQTSIVIKAMSKELSAIAFDFSTFNVQAMKLN